MRSRVDFKQQKRGLIYVPGKETPNHHRTRALILKYTATAMMMAEIHAAITMSRDNIFSFFVSVIQAF
jgi:hypothetical protein